MMEDEFHGKSNLILHRLTIINVHQSEANFSPQLQKVNKKDERVN